jgi:hypothetical protein
MGIIVMPSLFSYHIPEIRIPMTEQRGFAATPRADDETAFALRNMEPSFEHCFNLSWIFLKSTSNIEFVGQDLNYSYDRIQPWSKFPDLPEETSELRPQDRILNINIFFLRKNI